MDRATVNLPARDLQATAIFYAGLGFEQIFRDHGWMILQRGALVLEFFAFRGLVPATSSHSCCLRLDDVDAFFDVCVAAGVPITDRGFPRLHAPRMEESGLRIGALIDPNGTLLRLIANPPAQ